MMPEESNNETKEAPWVMGESVLPPSEVTVEVDNRIEDFVGIRIWNNQRTVNTWVALTPDQAEELAEDLSETADQCR